MNEAEALIGIASERAKERQVRKPISSVPEPVPEQKNNSDARDEVGALLGVSGRTVSDIALVSYCPLPASYTVLIQTVLRQVLAGP